MAEIVPWNTRLEFYFLEGLGTWHPEQKRTKASLLRGYLKSCQLRKDWDGMKPAEVVRLANSMLNKEQE